MRCLKLQRDTASAQLAAAVDNGACCQYLQIIAEGPAAAMLCDSCLPDKQVRRSRAAASLYACSTSTGDCTALPHILCHNCCPMQQAGCSVQFLSGATQAAGSVQLAAVPAAEGSLHRKEFDAHSATVYRLAPGDGGAGSSDAAASGSAANGGGSGGRGGGGGEAGDVLLIACSREVGWTGTCVPCAAVAPNERAERSTVSVPGSRYGMVPPARCPRVLLFIRVDDRRSAYLS